jgi:hypothetical protein
LKISNSDGSIDFESDVDLYDKSLIKLTLKFRDFCEDMNLEMNIDFYGVKKYYEIK